MAASSAGGRRGEPELSSRALKEKAVAFYSQHDVAKSLERLLNEMFPSPPPDIYGYMVSRIIDGRVNLCIAQCID